MLKNPSEIFLDADSEAGEFPNLTATSLSKVNHRKCSRKCNH